MMKKFWADTRGVTPTEHALLAAFASLLVAGAMAVMGKNLSGVMDRVVAALGQGTDKPASQSNIPRF